MAILGHDEFFLFCFHFFSSFNFIFNFQLFFICLVFYIFTYFIFILSQFFTKAAMRQPQ